MKKISLFFILLLPVMAFCQETISGRVLSDKQQPLSGASIYIPNTTTGALTNANGEFTLNNIPPGTPRVAVSYIGFKTTVIDITEANKGKSYKIILSPNVHELEGVTINRFDPDGWERWGETFMAAFIGTSTYAAKCEIKNKEAVSFIFTNSTKVLHAYASEPVIILNNSLGYRITVTLADFSYNTETKNVDYQVYSFFEEMDGDNKTKERWKNTRAKAYGFSLMHFMRALYAGTASKEGFDMRRLVRKRNVEKLRVQDIYKKRFQEIRDSLSTSELRESVVNKLIERSFARDSLKYYRKVLEQEDGTKKLQDKAVNEKQIAKPSGNNSVKLHFKDYLVVTYMKAQEPEEYFNYRKIPAETSNYEYVETNSAISWPVTELILQQDIPLEISENGYFTNIDLYFNGFWGWWEKMATKLPYGYQP